MYKVAQGDFFEGNVVIWLSSFVFVRNKVIPGNILKLLTSRNHFASWITKATNAHSEFVILTDFARQQWLCEDISLLLYSTFSVSFYLFFELIAAAVRRDSYSRTVQFESRPGHWQSLFEFFLINLSLLKVDFFF